MGCGAAKGLWLRAGHVAGSLVEGGALGDYEHISKRRRERRNAAGIARDNGDLRNEARGLGDTRHEAGVSSHGDDAFLYTRAGGFINADNGNTGLDGEVINLGELFGINLTHRAVEDFAVLAKDAHAAAINSAVAGHHAIGIGAVMLATEIGRAVAG